MTDRPNWEDPDDPAWDNPPGRSMSGESLIKLGRVYAGEALGANEAIDAGIRAMAERGYRLESTDLVNQALEEHFEFPSFMFIRDSPD